MQKFEYLVADPIGLHARPADALVRKAKSYASKITVFANGKECDATRLMALMGMCIKSGTTVTVTVEGSDEDRCAAELEAFFQHGLWE